MVSHWILPITFVLILVTWGSPATAIMRLKCTNRTMPRVAIINDVPWHFEIIAGFLHVIAKELGPSNLDVYLDDFTYDRNPVGSWDLIGEYPATFKRISNLSSWTPVDVAITISPEYHFEQNKALIKAIKPKQVLVMIHNGEDVFTPLDEIRAIHPNVTLVTLSPHVADFVSKRVKFPVGWLLPIHPFRPTERCMISSLTSTTKPACVSGFVMQGNLSPKRRNYSSIWNQIDENAKQLKQYQENKQFHLNVIGRTSSKEPPLIIPSNIKSFISIRANLNFLQFYDVIHHSYGLLPSLANEAYYVSKFSSTIITSLSTETPIVATQQLLQAYSFLQPDTVFLQPDGQEEIDSMLAIMKMTNKQVYSTRARVLRLRVALNLRAKVIIDEWIASMCPPAPGRRENTTEHALHWTERTAFFRAGWSDPSLRVYRPPVSRTS